MSEENKESKSLFNMDVKDLAGLSEPLKRVIDCLDKGISSLMHPFAYAVPSFVSHNDVIPYNQIQSLMDCGFLNPTECIWEIDDDCIIRLKGKQIQIKLKQKISL